EQSILNLASVFGTRFNLYDVAEVGSWRDEAVVSAIQKGCNLHMIAVDSSSTGSYQFAHDNIAQAFYQFLDSATLRKTHAKVGCYLEKYKRGAEEERIFDLAYHFARSGETDRALHYLTEAGDLSYRIYANRQAVEYYLQSLRILHENREKLFEKGSDADHLAHHLHEHLGDVYVLLGEYGKAIEHFEFAAPLAITPLERARLERKIGQALFHAGELDAPVRHFKRCLALLGYQLPESDVGVILSILGKVARQLFPSAIRSFSLRSLFMSVKRREVWREMALEVVRSCAVLTELFYFTQSLARSFQVHMTALNIAESIGDCRELAEIYLIHGFNCFMGGWFNRGLRYEQLGRAIYERLEDTGGVAKAYCYEGYAHMWAGNWDRGIEAARRSANLLEMAGNLWQVEINYANWAFGYIHKGEFDRAINVLRELRAIIKSKRTERGLIDYHNHIALAYCRKGYLEQATEHVKEAERFCGESRQKFYLATTYTVYGEIFSAMEQYEDAESYLDKAIQIIQESRLVGDYAVWPSIVRAKVRVREFAARAEGSESHKKLKLADLEKDCRKALSLARRFRNHLSSAERTYGTFYEISGKYEKAEASYKESLKIAENMGSIYDAALSYAALGNLLIRLNERSPAGINALLKGEELLREASAAIDMAKVKRTLNYIMPDREGKAAEKGGKPSHLLSHRVVEEQKIGAILQMGSVMSSVLKIDVLLEKIMDLAVTNFSAHRGFLILDEEILRLGQEKLSELKELGGEVYERLRSEFLSDRAVVLKDPHSKQRLVVKVARNVERGSLVTEEFQLSRTVIQKVFDTGKPALIIDAIKDPELQTQKSVLLHQLRSIMCVPLRFVGNVLGVIYLDNSYVSELFTKQDLQILRYFASQAVVAIENVLIFRKFNIALNRMKELQSQLLHTEKISAIGQAVAKISHEINNPLTSIAGYAGMLKQVIPQDIPKAKEYCDIIHKESHRCARLVKEMLAFSRKSPTELKRADLNQIIEESIRITDFFRPQNVTLQFERNPNLPQVVIDRGQMEQVFVNIISNAYQALASAKTPAGKVIVTAVMNQPDRIAVCFSDNGPGIDPTHQKKVFEPFFTTKEKGTGLGLSIAYYIVQKHGGSLSFESELGKGTSFAIELPALTAPSAEEVSPAERKAA
ncbi:MAG: GAF domain-containing protein, partial [Deltaproteobacteria bacterium]|nr:GAF domain-containing protein [Deltaproteobacteria bacterium]